MYGTVHYGTWVYLMPNIYVAIYLRSLRSTSDHAMIYIAICTSFVNNMADNNTIEIVVNGKTVQLTPQQIAVVSSKIQEKYGQALDGARPLIVKAVNGLPTTLDFSQAGNPRIQVQLPKGISCMYGNLYFGMNDLDSASKMYRACLNEFPDCVDKLKQLNDDQINAESKKLALKNKDKKEANK